MDRIAFGVMRASRQIGLSIPHDLSVIGHDNLPASADPDPPLSTMELPIAETGERLASMLLKRISGADICRNCQESVQSASWSVELRARRRGTERAERSLDSSVPETLLRIALENGIRRSTPDAQRNGSTEGFADEFHSGHKLRRRLNSPQADRACCSGVRAGAPNCDPDRSGLRPPNRVRHPSTKSSKDSRTHDPDTR